MRMVLVEKAGASLILASLAGCQNSTAALESEAVKPPSASASAPSNVASRETVKTPVVETAPAPSKTVSVRDGVTEAVRICTSQGPKFERTVPALKRASYSLGAAKRNRGGTVREALSKDGKFIIKLGTAANGFKSCQVLFRSTSRTQRSIAKAIAVDGRLVSYPKGGAANPYRFKKTGHPATVAGPLTSATSRDVGVLFTISQAQKS